MARPKVREIGASTVRWIASGKTEAIRSVKISHKPNGYAADCWICGEQVGKGLGVIAWVEVASKDAPLSTVIHEALQGHSGCISSAIVWRDAIAARNRQSAPEPLPNATPREQPLPLAPKPARPSGNGARDPGAPAASGDPRETFRSWLGVGDTAPVDEEQVRAIVAEALRGFDGLRPRVEIRIGEAPPVRLPESAHAASAEALAVVTGPQRLCWLVGPTGTGKTFLARQMAETLGAQYFEQACYGASESALVGFPTAVGDYVVTPTVAAVDATREPDCSGVLLCLDEFDACDESAALALNSLLAGDGVATPRRSGMGHTPRGKAPLYIVVTSNTDGTGYGSREYNARAKLDDATRDRLSRFRVWVDYDRAVERAYVEATGLPASVADRLWSVREKVAERKLEGRHVSTRAFRYLGELHAAHPDRWTPEQLLEKEFATWTDEERAKVGAPARPNGRG